VLGRWHGSPWSRGWGEDHNRRPRPAPISQSRTAVYLAGDEQNYITEQDVIKKLGVRPDQVVDYKALVGDKSDNIPGVPGVGEKTAIALLEKFGTLDGIYKNIDQVENRWKNKLEAGKESAYRSYNLALIRTDLQVKFDLEHARSDIERDIVARFDQIELFFKDLEFRTLIKTLEKLAGRDKGETPGSNGPALIAQRGASQSTRAASGQMSMFVNQPEVITTRVSPILEVVIVD
jgi:5'-3' exonuclease